MAQQARTFYILTRRGGGHGIGHWKRSCRLAEALQSREGEPPVQAGVILPWEDAGWRKRLTAPPENTLILCDCRETPKEIFRELYPRGIMAGIDEGGACRDQFDLLADYLPALSSAAGRPVSPPNFYLSFPQGAENEMPSGSVPGDAAGAVLADKGPLVSFGGEDPAGLTESFLQVYRRLPASRRLPDSCGTAGPVPLRIVRGQLFRSFPEPAGDFQEVRNPESLDPHIRTASLVVTSWGMTLWEAAQQGKPAVIINPTAYHDALCRSLNLPHHPAGRRLTPARLQGLIGRSEEVPRRLNQWREHHPLRDPVSFFVAVDIPGALALRTSPAQPSSSGEAPVAARQPRRNYRRDPRWGRHGFLFQQPLMPPGREYGRDYFSREYQAQYGRTYLEDFDHIKVLGARRMEILRRHLPAGGSLLDIGCAYGPFLQAAFEAGMSPFGLDISAPAAAYVRDELGFPSRNLSFLDWDPEGGPLFPAEENGAQWDAVTLWYVLEHLPDLAAVGRRLRCMVRPGGILAAALPNRLGLTGRFLPEKFLWDNPQDHYLLFDPEGLSDLLESWGFETVEISTTGIHPERFTGWLRGIPRPLRVPLARRMGWGDTFEIYARRRRGL